MRMNNFFIFLRQHRKKLGLTQEDVARKTGISRTYIARIETDIHYPSLTTALILSKFLGFSLDDVKITRDKERK